MLGAVGKDESVWQIDEGTGERHSSLEKLKMVDVAHCNRFRKGRRSVQKLPAVNSYRSWMLTGIEKGG